MNVRGVLGFVLAVAAVAACGVTEAPPSTPCAPACRAGYVCAAGACVSACNPPCAVNERCTVAAAEMLFCAPVIEGADAAVAVDARADTEPPGLDALTLDAPPSPDAVDVVSAPDVVTPRDDGADVDAPRVGFPDVQPFPADGPPLVCSPELADCDRDRTNGCEVHTGSDRGNCGACWNECAETDRCVGGACVGCAGPCGANERCVRGACVPCPTGTTLCAGECRNLLTDRANCGACGTTCTGSRRVCDRGECR